MQERRGIFAPGDAPASGQECSGDATDAGHSPLAACLGTTPAARCTSLHQRAKAPMTGLVYNLPSNGSMNQYIDRPTFICNLQSEETFAWKTVNEPANFSDDFRHPAFR